MIVFKSTDALIVITYLFTLLLSTLPSSSAFLAALPRPTLVSNKNTLELKSASSSLETNDASHAVIPSSRFVVQNRFKVRSGREAAFEKRWADRESRLGTLNGFRFFCMLRRIGGGSANNSNDDNDEPNYVSCTVWETFQDFEVWRTGDAFKEAHGGGTVGGVISMLAASARNTQGKPKPAYWQGLLPEVVPGNPPADSEGWNRVEADGINMISSECFVAMNRFSVKPGMGNSFEARFASRESTLKGYEGFRGFLLLRRDGDKKPGDGGDPDDGFTHSTFSTWESKANFDAWMADAKEKARNEKADQNQDTVEKSPPPPPIYSRPPIPSFYEGIVSLESTPGV